MEPEVKKPEPAINAVPSLKDDYVSKMQAQGKEWDAQLALWGAKAEKTSEALKAEFHSWQREFSDKRGAANKKLETLNTAKHEAWEEVKTGADTAWTDVKTAFENAKKKFA